MNAAIHTIPGITRYHVHGRPIPTPMPTHTGRRSKLTPTSRTSRQKIMAANRCWPPRNSRTSWSISIAGWDCDCQASWSGSGSMRLLLHQFAQGFFRPVQLHADVALGDAQHLGHLAVAEAV